ncbi:MAG: DNA alkylation repair protein [Ruminococcaceae bacterium]|nr:DNA alkylation repair protein [Oscillospiraceae bacterium]
MSPITERLLSLADEGYRQFQISLMPIVDPARVIGVRTPVLRKLAKELAGTPEAQAFLRELPHTYYEENNLHAFLVEQIKDYDGCIAAIDAFLPYVDNWSTCDGWSPKVIKKHPEDLLCKIREWMSSDHPYTVRYGIGMLQRHFLDDRFCPEYLEWVARVDREEYYVRMMVAWYFATALAKQYEATLPYMRERCLPEWTHNKAIQKAVESYRVTDEHKEQLKQYKCTKGRL